VGYGKNVDGAETILQNTASALRDLAVRITGLRGKGWDGEVWAVRINSGKFGVEWRRTRAVLEGGEVGMKVMAPKEEEGEGSEDGGEGGGGGGVCGGGGGGGGERRRYGYSAREGGEGQGR